MAELVIVRHYEPEPPEETAALLSRVYDRLFSADVLERLTRPSAESTIQPNEKDEKGAKDESCTLRES
jgi:hypothetical protein